MLQLTRGAGVGSLGRAGMDVDVSHAGPEAPVFSEAEISFPEICSPAGLDGGCAQSHAQGHTG